MIAMLSGVISEKMGDQLIVDVQGIGYGILLPSEEFNRLRIGEHAKFYIHEHIRDDSHDLYGFIALHDKELFEQLLTVKNVGPKVALAVLSIGSGSVVRGAIAGGDIRMLQSAKGVGKRAAEQMVVELRDKVGITPSGEAEDIVGRGGININDEAFQALVALGYTEADALRVLQPIDSELSTEERVKKALGAR
jgi:Holliday junction DNA helicase RuvA